MENINNNIEINKKYLKNFNEIRKRLGAIWYLYCKGRRDVGGDIKELIEWIKEQECELLDIIKKEYD